MNCPKCKAEMEQIQICEIEIDRCSRCRGIWFDQQEQDQIQCGRGTHKADVGHQAIGEHYNQLRDIQCPRCHVAMQEKELRRGRIPIQIEACPQCGGSYFDAGEFRDFAEPTIMEFAKDLIARLKERVGGNAEK